MRQRRLTNFFGVSCAVSLTTRLPSVPFARCRHFVSSNIFFLLSFKSQHLKLQKYEGPKPERARKSDSMKAWQSESLKSSSWTFRRSEIQRVHKQASKNLKFRKFERLRVGRYKNPSPKMKESEVSRIRESEIPRNRKSRK